MGAKQQFQTTKPPKSTAASDGILLEPKQTLDDVIERVNEVSPTFTLLAARCTTESEFDAKTVKTYSFGFAVPHIVKTSNTDIADDPRGVLAELMRTGVSFKNVSNQDVTLHANVPIAKQHYPGSIYTRLSGFHSKSKKNQMTDDIVLKPGQTGTFKTNLKGLANEYVPMEQVKESRVWINLITFAVVVKNINQETGAAYNTEASILEARPKALYTKRKSNPILESGQTLTMQSTENFVLQALDGYSDLYMVDPVSAAGGNKASLDMKDNIYKSVAQDMEVFRGGDVDATFIQDAVREGDLLGVHRVLVTKKNDDHQQQHVKSYYGAGLIVKRVGGNERPLELSSRQSGGARLIIMGFNVAASPNSPPVFFSNWKWDPNVGHWVLWDDYEQQARYADDHMTDFTPISTGMPVMLIEGVYTKMEKEEMERKLLAIGYNSLGQPYGKPKAFGDFLRKAISVLEVVGKVAGFIGTLL
jgi:hypothetical protein